jgi:hypothetical protein
MLIIFAINHLKSSYQLLIILTVANRLNLYCCFANPFDRNYFPVTFFRDRGLFCRRICDNLSDKHLKILSINIVKMQASMRHVVSLLSKVS